MSRPTTRPGRGPISRPGKVPPKAKPRPATLRDWISGARIRTLPLAVAPVLVGTGAAMAVDDGVRIHWLRALAALAVALCLQIGVNYANDYSDGIRGTDAYRQGPARLTGSGRAKPRTVLAVALVFLGLAAVVGLVAVIVTGRWWLLAVGAAAIVAAWFYTGGKRPYGYYGLGEVFVFLFFGLAATAGTQYLEWGHVTAEGWYGSVAVGFIACAVLMVNNLRDIDSDRAARKRTLAVLVGRTWAKSLYTFLLLFPFAMLAGAAIFYPVAWSGMLVLLAALPAVLIVWTAKTPRELVIALQLTGFAGLLYGLALGAGFAFWVL